MKNIWCRSCKRMVAPGRFCDNCSAPLEVVEPRQYSGNVQTRNPWKAIAIVCAIIFGVVIISSAIEGLRKQTGPSNVSNPPALAQPSGSPPVRPPDNYSQFITTAKTVLRSEVSEIDLSSASTNLISIPSSAAEYREAQQLLPQIQKRLREARERAEIEANPLNVVSSHWEKGGFGTVALWKVTFYNRSDKPVGNIKYRTAYFAETGAKVDSGGVDSLLGKNTIQKIVAPHQKRTIEINDGFLNSEAHKANFEIVSWEYIRQ